MRTDKNFSFDIVYLGTGISCMLHFLKHKQNYVGKTVCFVEKNSRIDTNKTISGFASRIDLPINRSYNKFVCSWGAEIKTFETEIPYHIVDLEELIEQFKRAAIGCTFFFDSPVLDITHANEFHFLAGSKKIQAKMLFDSRPPKIGPQRYLKQHFHGWFVEFYEPHAVDDPVIMDIDTESSIFRFLYLLPLNKNNLLIEITYFSEDISTLEEYETLIQSALSKKFPKLNWKVHKKESGVIPLIAIYPLEKYANYKCLGVRGGYLRASTGYSAFQSFYNNRPSKLVDFLDRFLIKVLMMAPEYGAKIFVHFFRHMDGTSLASFMSYQPSLKSIIKAVMAMPKLFFLGFFFKRAPNGLTSMKIRDFND